MASSSKQPASKSASGGVCLADLAAVPGKRCSAKMVSAPKPKPRRVLSKQNTDEQVSRSLRDNFKGLSQVEKHHNRNQHGQTLAEAIAERKRLNRLDRLKYPCGERFYRDLRQQFFSDENPLKRLSAKNDGDVVAPRLMSAMVKYKQTGSKDAMGAFIRLAVSVNQKEVVGICRFALEIKPTSSAEQLRLAMDVLRFFVRLEMKSKFAEEISIMSTWIDSVLVAALQKCKGAAAQPSRFVAQHRDLLALTADLTPIEALLKASKSWDGLETELAIAVNGSKVGMQLFGPAYASVLASLIRKETDKSVEKLLAKESAIKMADIRECIQNIVDGIEGEHDLGCLPELRAISVEYRGCSLSFKVRSLNEEVEMRTWVACKAAAAAAGLLPGLFMEDDLVDTHMQSKVTFEDTIFKGCVTARENANEHYMAMGARDAGSLISMMRSRESEFAASDRWFRIEAEFILQMSGDAGRLRLQNRVLSLFPSEEHYISLEESIQRISHLQTGALFQFCSSDAQGELLAVSETLQSMLLGHAPVFARNLSKFVEEMRAKLGDFARLELEGENGNVKILKGAEAVKHALKAAEQLPKANVKLDDVKLPTVYSWLLKSDADVTLLSKLRQSAMDNERKTAAGALRTVARAAAASSSKSSSSNKKKRSAAETTVEAKRPKQNPEVAVAMEMFS